MAKYIDLKFTTGLVIGTDKVLLTESSERADFRGLAGSWNIYAGGGDDYLWLNSNGNWVDAGDGNDRVTGGFGADSIVGGAGDDVLNGGRGNDVLVGGAGRDILMGAAQVGNQVDNDQLTGGGAADAFYFGPTNMGNDVISDYGKADIIVLEGATIADYDVVQSGNDATITFNDGRDGSITIKDAHAADVHVQLTDSYQHFYSDFYV
jgi:Ca2+-binding RTX toxin-like protein